MYRPSTVIWFDDFSPGLFSLQSIGTEKWDGTREGMAHTTIWYRCWFFSLSCQEDKAEPAFDIQTARI